MNPGTQMWAGGRVLRMVSIAAANATAKYMAVSPTALSPIFDARVHTFDSLDEAREYVVWRRADATKNANTLHSHKALMGWPTSARLELLRGTEHEHLPAESLNGRLIVKEYGDEPVIYTDRRRGRILSKFAKGSTQRHPERAASRPVGFDSRSAAEYGRRPPPSRMSSTAAMFSVCRKLRTPRLVR